MVTEDRTVRWRLVGSDGVTMTAQTWAEKVCFFKQINGHDTYSCSWLHLIEDCSHVSTLFWTLAE